MEKTIEPVNFNASQELIATVSQIFDKLEKFNDRIVKADIYLKALTETPQGLKKLEARIFLPGKDIFVEQEADSFVSAAQQAFDRIKILLIKEKEKAAR
jgi:putative sigma-54 modulation protein